jgi:nickel-dependent lactate racemase
VSRTLLEELPEPADAVITTSAGYPLDLTFYQAIKGVTAASHIVKPGGRILLAAACEEGAGAPEFREMLRENISDEDFLRKIQNAPVVVDQWQLEKFALVTTRAGVIFYTPGLPPEYHSTVWGRVCASVGEAVGALTAGLARGSMIAVIPEGPYVLAKAAR